ncbi:hypothetical protein C8R43DRAFT_1233324 [Mycena crocata]|nr:hypothetical protein C8R43DRAFT_1233324 [Mycena crocata]
MDLVASHPELAPGFLNVLSDALKKAETRVKELETELQAKSSFPAACALENPGKSKMEELLNPTVAELEPREAQISQLKGDYEVEKADLHTTLDLERAAMQEERRRFPHEMDLSRCVGKVGAFLEPANVATSAVQANNTNLDSTRHAHSEGSVFTDARPSATVIDVDQDAGDDDAVEPDLVCAEQLLYMDYMATLPAPAGLPPTVGLKHIDCSLSISAYVREVVGFKKPCFYFANRTIWCSNGQHALVYCPTHIYDPLWREWWLRPSDAAPIGEARELFVAASNSKGMVYVGTYILLSLQHIHAPGSEAPLQVTRRQLSVAAGIPEGERGERGALSYFPGGFLPTECFGLQRVGFNEELYSALQHHQTSARPKRKAEEDVDGKKKKKKKKKPASDGIVQVKDVGTQGGVPA